MGCVMPWALAQKGACVVCGSPFTERHHVFPGSFRKKSEEWGYTLPLCRRHHTGNDGIHFNRPMMLHYQQLAQRDFEARFGTRELFIKEFGKSRL